MLGRGESETADSWSDVDEWIYTHAHSKGLVKPGGHTNKNKTKGHKTGRDLLKGERERGEEKVCVLMCLWG